MRLWLLWVCLILGPLGCVQPPQGPVFPPIPYYIYTVRHDAEPLALISKWYTGASENARALITHNPQLNPTAALAVGDQIRIPEMMLITRKAIPEEVFAKLKSRVAKRPGVAAAAPTPAKTKATPKTVAASPSVPAKAPVKVTAKAIEEPPAPLAPTALASATAKLETFEEGLDEEPALVSPDGMATPVVTPNAIVTPSIEATLALSPAGSEIFKKSAAPSKPNTSKSTYEQMQESLAK